MLIIYTTPPLFHKTVEEYTNYILNRYVIFLYRNGTTDVHVVLDDPQSFELSPKMVEREQRDKRKVPDDDHKHHEFQDSLPPSSKWNNMLQCRECKHNLTTQLALHMLKHVTQYLTHGKRFIVAGSLRGVYVTKHCLPMFVLSHLPKSSIKSSTLSLTNSLDRFQPL